MRKYDSEHTSQNSAWSKLTTITTFDRGKSESRRWRKGNALVLAKGAQATLSILVESLIDQLCKLTEKDPVTQKILYKLICKKLCKMKLIDKTYKIEEYQFMRTYYQRALQKLLSISCSPSIETQLGTYLNQSPTALSLLPSRASVFAWSRYQSEFEEIQFIARGGFGQVFRVRNKVDGREYAIKKIHLRYQNEYKFIESLNEVRTLASLDHPNIVAYKAAWFEPFSDVVVEAASSSDSSSPKISHGFNACKSDVSVSEQEIEEASSSIIFTNKTEEYSKLRENVPLPPKFSSVNETCSHFKIHKVETEEKATSTSQCYSRKISKYPKKNEKLSDQDCSFSSKTCEDRKLRSRQMSYEYAVLHIQMQLCKESLRDWLDLRNDRFQPKSLESFPSNAAANMQSEQLESYQLSLDKESLQNALDIFLKILYGVEYIHAKHIIHRDLKPSNIFLEGFDYHSKDGGALQYDKSEDGLNHRERNCWRQVRVGDFGLACQLESIPIQTCHPLNSDKENSEPEDKKLILLPPDLIEKMKSPMKMGGNAQGEVKEKEVIGTKLYAAPEQLEGDCNIQSDMYSLGIILFELLLPIYTGMERIETLSALRNGTIPANFELQYPMLVRLVRKLLSHNPSHRPSVRELIKSIKDYMEKMGEKPNDFQREAIRKSVSKDMLLIQETKTEHLYSVSHYESRTRDQHGISNDMHMVTSGVSPSKCSCGNPTCHIIREEQEKTISRLKEENLEKDEIILKLRKQISNLQLNKHSTISESDS